MVCRTQAVFEALAWVNEKATKFMFTMPAASLGVLWLPVVISKLKAESSSPSMKVCRNPSLSLSILDESK